jgi:folate-dependent phosphoribosylglycinamide formyltransferase PurN
VRTALICHRDTPIGREELAAWLASFSDLCGIVEIHERRGRQLGRLRFEARRSGLRVLDVLAFRLYYKLRFARRDGAFMKRQREELRARFGDPPAGIAVHATTDPNSPATRAFLERIAPDLVLARCKTLLKPEVFSVPRDGTMVVHPGICPEYRNAHGCFWALASRDTDRVGATLLRIDEGIDTGPVFAYYRADFDEVEDSHVVIQHRVVFDNLDAIAADLAAIHEGARRPIDTTGRASSVWGQPRLSDWLRWKRLARRERLAPRERRA